MALDPWFMGVEMERGYCWSRFNWLGGRFWIWGCDPVGVPILTRWGDNAHTIPVKNFK